MAMVGRQLRGWRERRRVSQLDLSLQAGISARHLSFVETGRSRPSSGLILRLSEELEVPLRERNALLLAAGFAPAYPEHGLDAPPLSAVTEAMRQVITAHMPNPALAVDGHWELIDANDAVSRLIEGSAAELLEPPVNVLRLSLHPDGMAARITNLGQWRQHVLFRLRRQADRSGDPFLHELHEELRGYPGGDPTDGRDGAGGESAADVVLPLRIRVTDAELSFLSTTTVFGSPLDVTVAELAIESFYPADAGSAAAIRALVPRLDDRLRGTRRVEGVRFPGRPALRVRKALLYAGVGLLVAAAAIAVALAVTPLQETAVAGEEIGVGAAAPTLSLSGPGEVDLFGQRLPTTLQFAGPVRPRLTLSHITLNRQLASMFDPAHGTAPAGAAIGHALAAAWTRYFVWEAVITGAGALLLTGALCGWARFPLRKTLVLLVVGLAVAEAADLGGIMVTAYTAPARLAKAGSLTGLVGQAPLPDVAPLTGPERGKVQAVVLGDSTAAALGNPLVAHPSKQDRACHRSSDSYAADLAAVNNWDVLNLACSGATIHHGILGSQQAGSVTVPPQLAQAREAAHARLVIVSIGANDLGWSGLVGLCAAANSCADSASAAYFQQHLNTFASQYYQMLEQLATLPSHPRVLINLYYDPFDTTRHCLNSHGLTPAKEKVLTKLLDALNQVLSNGAAATSQISVQPDFTGHALCDPAPYVQGVGSAAPFHPTAAGELAIALADEQALQQAPGSPSGSPPAVLPSVSPSGQDQSG